MLYFSPTDLLRHLFFLISEKIINELMKLSEQTSVYIAEYLKTALKHSKKLYNESKHKSKSESDSNHDRNSKDDEQSGTDEKPDIKPTDIVHNGSFKKPVRDTNGHEPQKNSCSRHKAPVPGNFETSHDTCSSFKHKTQKRVHDSGYVCILN